MDLINEEQFDINAPHIYKTTEEAAKAVEEYTEKLSELAAKTDDNTWATKNIPVFRRPMKIMEIPLMQACRMMLFESIHHRGQLTSYYRMLGVK
jgi:uncharacterized damage-inducible protein DinB